MQYNYEALDDKQFQRLAQALVAASWPDLQAFPLGESDGGRDVTRPSGEETVVYQVKFARAPDSVGNSAAWVISALEAERHKLERLSRRGPIRYEIITNVRGTGAPDRGGVDTVQDVLDSLPVVRGRCVWRTDLDALLNSQPFVRWAFPEILSAADIIPLFRSAIDAKQVSRRERAIQSYMIAQSERDRTVKFKQVDLDSDLLALFVDVPVSYRESAQEAARHRRVYRQTAGRLAYVFDHVGSAGGLEFDGLNLPGGAHFLLHPGTAERYSAVVIEGSPGQGKSTLSQYVAEYHRLHLLGRSTAIAELPSELRNFPVRVPFKIDLRDFAGFTRPQGAGHSSQLGHPSLDQFLAEAVSDAAGGVEFSVDDLHEIFSSTPVIVVLDGLDEVADIDARKEVVSSITGSIQRLSMIGKSVQFVVTSRPAAYANSPGFSSDVVTHFELVDMRNATIEEFCKKWSRARSLNAQDEQSVTQTLIQRLGEPHVAELARNPMQLAILLNMIYQRGPALPNQRTELYDSYVDLLLARETEKSAVVREHRELLLDVHQYLAWLLHAESESEGGTGAIGVDRLRTVLTDFLTYYGHETEILDDLFTGVVERVFALVQRRQGEYEFLVQSIREYFCAKYLFDTAPPSTAGDHRLDDRIDRFASLVRNPYWLNVARFFAGCSRKGELSGLLNVLKEWLNDPLHVGSFAPRRVAIMLAGDFVFTQLPNTLSEVMTVGLDPIGGRLSTGGPMGGPPTRLPANAGRSELIQHHRNVVTNSLLPEMVVESIRCLGANDASDSVVEALEERLENVAPEAALSFLALTRTGARVGVDYCLALVDRIGLTEHSVSMAIRSGIGEAVLDSSALQGAGVSALRRSPLAFDVDFIDPFGVIALLIMATPAYPDSDDPRGFQVVDFGPYCTKAAETYRRHGLASLGDLLPFWQEWTDANPALRLTSLEPWRDLVAQIRIEFGESALSFTVANEVGLVKNRSEVGDRARELFDESRDLTDRCRYARFRAGDVAYWERHLDAAPDHLVASVVGMALSWCSSRAVDALEPSLLSAMGRCTEDDLEHVRRMVANGPRPRLSPMPNFGEPSQETARLVSLVAPRLSAVGSSRLLERYLRSCDVEPLMAPLILRSEVGRVLRRQADLELAIDRISEAARTRLWYGLTSGTSQRLTLDGARRVLSSADRLPASLVLLAGEVVDNSVRQALRPLMTIATENNWSVMELA